MSFYSEWNNLIANWDKNPVSLQPLAFGNSGLDFCYLPEPYYGDMNNCSIVIINLNPGGGLPEQRWNSTSPGNLVIDVRLKDYNGYATSFPPLNGNYPTVGKNWWRKRAAWIGRILASKGITSIKDPFAIELCPFHSHSWKIKNATKYVKNFIYVTGIDIIDAIETGIRNSDAQLGIAIGKSIYKVLLSCGYCDVSPFPFSPIPNNCREYHLLEKDGVKIMCTWTRGGNLPPAPRFDPFEKNIISNTIKP